MTFQQHIMWQKIIIKTPAQIENLRHSGKLLTELLHILYDACKPGVSLLDLENIAQNFMDTNKVTGAFKWYQWFPANLCTSVNDCVVHGIPDNYILKNGDLLKIDCGVVYKKAISDSAISIVIGGDHTNPTAAKLVQDTKDALDYGLQFIKPGAKVHDYSSNVFKFLKERNTSVIKVLTGHGVGVELHEPPYIHNRPHPETKKTMLRPWMVIAIEPITALWSTDYTDRPGNERNLYTSKWDLGAQREYMILITETGHEILAGITERK